MPSCVAFGSWHQIQTREAEAESVYQCALLGGRVIFARILFGRVACSPPLSLADARRSGCSVAWLPGVARGWRAPTISREACDHSRKLPSARGSLAHLCVMKALFNTPCECGWSLFRVAHESPPASRPRPGNVDSHPRGWHRVSHTAHHDFHSFSPDFDRGVATRGGGAPGPHEQSAKSVLEPCCV